MADNNTPSTLLSPDDKVRREVIHLWPLTEGRASVKDLKVAVDNNGEPVLGNALSKEPILYEVAGLPNSITDNQCHGAQLELWSFRGAQMRRDICPRITDAPEPSNDKDEREKQVTNLANKMVRRRQQYRYKIEGGLMPGFLTTSKLFAEILSELTDDQLILASPWPVDLEKKVMINPKTSQEESVFKPQEVPEQIRSALDAARALSQAEQTKKGWKVIPNPPTLAGWLKDHPEFNSYDPQDDFHSDVSEADDEEKAEVKAGSGSRAGVMTGGTTTSNTLRAPPEQYFLSARLQEKAKLPTFKMSATGSGSTEQQQSPEKLNKSRSSNMGTPGSMGPPPAPITPQEQYPHITDEDRKNYSKSTIMVAEKEGLSPAFIQQTRGLPRDGPAPKPVFGPEHPPHMLVPAKTKAELFQAILDKLLLDKELYRDTYSQFAANKITRKAFEEKVAMPMLLANTGTMELHEQLMTLHGGGATWQHLDINTWGQRPGVDYTPIDMSSADSMQAMMDLWKNISKK